MKCADESEFRHTPLALVRAECSLNRLKNGTKLCRICDQVWLALQRPGDFGGLASDSVQGVTRPSSSASCLTSGRPIATLE
jgi:hypothetical protein